MCQKNGRIYINPHFKSIYLKGLYVYDMHQSYACTMNTCFLSTLTVYKDITVSIYSYIIT